VQTLQIFLSHATDDRVIAEALKKLLEDLFGKNRVRIDFSSDQEAGGGIAPGANWLTWITDRVTRDDKTYVLLTPSSMRKPWVLWESGAAAGVAMATKRPALPTALSTAEPPSPVVPITFGLTDAEVPGPLRSLQVVHGDTDAAGGILRELQAVNGALDGALTEAVFDATTKQWLPAFFTQVKAALAQSSSVESVLATVPHLFPAKALAGLWVTCYGFTSRGTQMYHADVVQITADSDRRLSVQNQAARTHNHATPFRHQIEAEIANRHLIGYWKNVSDTRYFGGLHLAVLPGENVMQGYYSSFNSDIMVGTGEWTWVRLDPASLTGVDFAKVKLRAPVDIRTTLIGHAYSAGTLALNAVLEG